MATERSVLVRLKADPTAFIAGFRLAKGEVSDLRRELDGADRSIDKFSGRLGLLLDTAAALGPALVPIGGVGVAAVAGLASALGMATLGAGTAVLAFQGVGDALGKVNKARLEPTVENLHAARLAMQQLGPDAQQLVTHLSNLREQALELRDSAAGGLLPGVDEALDSLIVRGPEVEKILHRIGHATGEILAEGADSLASDQWDDFFDFIKTEAPPAISSLGRTVGDLAHGLAELWMAFEPLNTDVLGWLETAADRFDKWARELDQTEGFQEFVDYIEANGPQVGETLGAIAMALLDIVEAAAPVGAATLPILEAVAKVLSFIAESDLGTPLIALLALSRATSLLGRGLDVVNRSWAGNVRGVSTFTDGVGKAGTAFVALSAAGLIIDTIRDKAAGAAPVVERLTAALIASNNEEFTSEFGSGIKDALGNLDQGGIDGIAQDLDNLAGKAGAAGTGAEHVLDVFGNFGIGHTFDDVSVKTQKTAQQFESLDAAMTGLVASAGPERAKRFFDSLAASQHLSVGQQEQFLAQLPQYQEALQGAANAAALAAEETEHQGHAAGDTSGALQGLTTVTDVNKDGVIDNTDAILENIAAMEERTAKINSAFDAETAFQRSLQIGADREKEAADIRKQIAEAESSGAEDRADLQKRLANARHDLATAKTPASADSARDSIASIQDQIADSLDRQADTVQRLREQLAEYAPTLDKTTKAGQANRDVLSQMAAGWNELSDKQQNAKGKFQEARDALIEQAKKFGASDKAAKGYADRLLEIPPRVATKLLLDKQEAQRQLDAFSKAFHGLDGEVARAFVQLRIDQITGPGGKLDRASRAGGFSGRDGGWTGNMPVNHVAGIVHGREFVVPAPHAERHRAELEARFLPGYQQGGFVEPARMVPAQVVVRGPAIDYDRLAETVARVARPVYGAVHMQPHNYGEFQRQMLEDARASSVGGLTGD